jgi:branched-chain amino acid aminotransferase
MVGVAYVDDAFIPAEEARIPLFDLGFLRGDAVYDTTSVWHGQFFRLDDHVARFAKSCAGMRLANPHGPEALKRILAECVHRAGLDDAFVQMIVTRGQVASMERRDLRECRNRFYAYAIPYLWIVRPEKQETGIDVAIVENRRTPSEAIDPTVKNFNWMDMQRGMFQGLDRGADNVVLLTPAGHLAEGPGFNLFFVKAGRLHTPDSNVLEGITRRTVADLARELGVALSYGKYKAEDLRGADEAFLSSTAGGVMPVTRIDGRPLGNGAPGVVTSDIRALYWRKREAGWLGTPVASLIEPEAGRGAA